MKKLTLTQRIRDALERRRAINAYLGIQPKTWTEIAAWSFAIGFALANAAIILIHYL